MDGPNGSSITLPQWKPNLRPNPIREIESISGRSAAQLLRPLSLFRVFVRGKRRPQKADAT